MKSHSQIKIAILDPRNRSELNSFKDYLEELPHVVLQRSADVHHAVSDTHIVVTMGELEGQDWSTQLTRFVQSGGGWLHLTGYSETPLPELFGVRPGLAGPATELRAMFKAPEHPMAQRLAPEIYLPGRFQELLIHAEDVEPILLVDWRFDQPTVMVCRSVGSGHVACTTLTADGSGQLHQILYRLLLHIHGWNFEKTIGVGILGYAPSVGRLHGLGCQATTGLDLRAVCDLNPQQRNAAVADFVDLNCYDAAERMAEDPQVDLLVVATPPNTHADLCLKMLAAGKHVVCEKPLAINRRETEALTAMAHRKGLHLSCHQNRRFDEDFLTIQKAVAAGRIGELFYMETFVGGFGHPCNHWHSHAPICGGTAYDWGAHYLDWIVALMPERIIAVAGTRHKRVWRDVTNADQERIQIRFAGGKEAEFIHSDIAAIRKPKWYLLGTEGAIIGQWRETIVYRSDPDIYFQWDEIPPTEMPPQIRIHCRRTTGEIEVIEPAMLGTHSPTFLSENRRFQYAFHHNLADHLLTGEPLAAPLADSVKVVDILEAAARSMANGGREEVLAD